MNLNKSWPLALFRHPFLWVLRFSTASFTPSAAAPSLLFLHSQREFSIWVCVRMFTLSPYALHTR